MNNFVHEKTMENIQNRTDIKRDQQRMLSKMDIETKLYVIQNI